MWIEELIIQNRGYVKIFHYYVKGLQIFCGNGAIPVQMQSSMPSCYDRTLGPTSTHLQSWGMFLVLEYSQHACPQTLENSTKHNQVMKVRHLPDLQTSNLLI